MPDWITGWFDRLSAGQLALVFCAFFVGVTWLGILLVHPWMRRLLHREEPSNELIIHIAGTFGLVYAVLLGLLTVATFQSTKDLQDDVGLEPIDHLPHNRCLSRAAPQRVESPAARLHPL